MLLRETNEQMVRLFAVLGNPIRHSLSPLMHNFAIKKLQLSALYTRFLLPQNINASDLKEFLLFSDLEGVNVTLPFKNEAFRAVDEVCGIAQEIGAINTIVKKESKLIAYNTDAEGFYRCIVQDKPKTVLLLGAGGSAKSIATILAKNGITLEIVNRTKEKLHFFKQFGETMDVVEFLQKSQRSYDLIINATSASLYGELPVQKEILQSIFTNSKIAFDLMYQDDLTPFCSLAKAHGMKVLDGKHMLLYQGALAFLYFHNFDVTDTNFLSVAELMAESLHISL